MTTPISIRIGTSGWTYAHWHGRFYPATLPQRAWLDFYASRFDTVEVNNSFYRLPTRETFSAWAAQTPADFCFAVKGSRFVTHLKRLAEPDVHVATFFDRAEALGEKLGPVLWQLRADFQRDDDRLDAFLASLPPNTANAIEFRHPSWLVAAVYARLERHGVALCLADRDGQAFPAEPIATTNWSYLRFHSGVSGGDYTAAQLDHWAGVIADFRARGISTYAYFNNDWNGYAPKNAVELRIRLTSSPKSDSTTRRS